MKKYIAILAVSIFFGIPGIALAQGKTIEVRAPQDAWQVRRAQTLAMIKVLDDENAAQNQDEAVKRDFDARLTACEKGELTPMETMDLLRVFYVP